MKKLLIIFLLFKTCLVTGQNFSYPVLIKHGKAITNFIPASWTLLDSVSGDLNNDKSLDYAIVLQLKDSVTIVKEEDGYADTVITQPRILAILFWDNNLSRFHLQECSNSFILNHDSPYMDDPYEEIKIEKNVLSIHFMFWYSWGSWWISNISYKFRFQRNEFALIGYESFDLHRATHETKSYSINFLTKKYSITTKEQINDESEEIKTNTEWKTFKLDSLKTLRTLAKPFTWYFENEISI